MDLADLRWVNAGIGGAAFFIFTVTTTRQWPDLTTRARWISFWFIAVLAVIAYGSLEAAIYREAIGPLLMALSLLGLVISLGVDWHHPRLDKTGDT